MVVVVFTRASSCRSDDHGRGRRSGRDRRRCRRMADRVADNAVQVAAVVIVRVGRARLNEPLLRLPHRRRKRDEPRRRGKRSAAARTTLLLRREASVVEPPALAGVLVVPRLTSEPAHVARRRVVHAPEELARAALLPRREPRVVVCAALVGMLVVPGVAAVPAHVTRRRVVDAPEKSSRRRSSGGVRGRSRDVSAGARPGSDLGKPRDVPARAAGPDHGDARPRGVGRAELPLAAAVGAATGPVASTPSTPSTRRLLDGVTMPALTARRRCTRRTA